MKKLVTIILLSVCLIVGSSGCMVVDAVAQETANLFQSISDNIGPADGK